MTAASRPAAAANDVEAAMKRAMRLLTVRSRSCHELADRLRRAGFDEATVDAVQERLVAVGLLDDAAFAHQVVRRGDESGKSAWLTRRELQRFGVDVETAERSLEGVDDPAADEERALRLAERKAASCRSLPADKAAARVVRHLGSRGYGAGLAWEVARRVIGAAESPGD